MRGEHPYRRARAAPHIASRGQAIVETGTSSLFNGLSRTMTRTLPPQRNQQRNARVVNQSQSVPSTGGQNKKPGTLRRHFDDLPHRSPLCGTSKSPSEVQNRMKTAATTAVRH